MFESMSLFAHSGHSITPTGWTHWIQWIGSYHLIFLHFPIALFTMAGVAELLNGWFKKPLFDQSVRFLLISGALIGVATVTTGLAFGYKADYQDLTYEYFFWHRLLGLTMIGLSFIVIFAKESYPKSFLYYGMLFILCLGVNVTAYFGGAITFGFFKILPPY